jgi:phenylalanyl-tRNA synthetase beta chain
MIVSWNWLTDHVRLHMPVETLTERLALAGFNHESTAEVGGDLAIDLEVTSNRPDCLSHIGVAREISVVFGGNLNVPEPHPKEAAGPVALSTSVTIEAPALCPRFTARLVTGATIRESPWWLRKRLETLGIRPVSNVVDITNYVMFECGQPLHAYDFDRLAGRKLIVRPARKGESIRAINDKVYELEPSMLAIADAERPVGLAGVMGGLETEIGPQTKTILIEAAQFDAMSVRATSRALGLFSPSSYRFERPMDPARTEWASRRCAELILELAGGQLHQGVVDVGSRVSEREAIVLRFAQIPRVLGITIAHDEVVRILRSLGLKLLSEGSDSVTFQPPTWRADLEREIDLIEEAARIHGYEHIPEDRPVPLTRSAKGPRERVEAEVRGVLMGFGFDEAATYSMVDDDHLVAFETGASVEPLRVNHSSRKKENILRTSLVPSLVAARAYNEAHGNLDAELFEIANVYLPRPGQTLPHEPTHLGIVSGREFFEMKGVVEDLIARLHIEDRLEAKPFSHSFFAPGRAAELRVGGTRLGLIGEIDAARLEALGHRGACSAAELSLDVLQQRAELIPRYRPLPPFPVVSRDLSLVLARSTPWAELADVARQAAGTTLESLEYLDVFAGGDIPAGKHSLHFGLRFRHPERTLTGEEVDRAVKAVVDACASRFDATLRG